MTDQGTGSAEGRHLAELISLLRQDLSEFREEMRESLDRRVTHAEVAGFMQLVEAKLAHLDSRVQAAEETVEDLERAHKEESKLRKTALYTGASALCVAAITGLGKPVIDALG